MFARLPKCSDKYTRRFRISTFVTIPPGPLAVKKKKLYPTCYWLTCLLLKEKLSKILNSVAARPADLLLYTSYKLFQDGGEERVVIP